MSALLDSFLSEGGEHWLIVLLDASVKGAVVLVAAGVIALALRRSSAARRHVVWTLALVGMILLPALSAVLPAMRVPVLQQGAEAVRERSPEPVATPPVISGAPIAEAEPIAELPPVRAIEVRPAARMEVVPTPPLAVMEPADVEPPAERGTPVNWAALALLGWAAGVVAALLPFAVGNVSVWRATRRARRITGGPWRELMDSAPAELRPRRPVRLLETRRMSVPMACGWFRPAILLPADADEWPADRRRAVLLHELAHVKRRDCLTQALARIACALYWFNPLAWLAAHRQRVERERACDDVVLRGGSKASDYAGHLLDIARGHRSGICGSVAAVAMARSSRLERRLRAILDARRSRRSVTRLTLALALVAAVGLVLPLAALSPTAAAERDTGAVADEAAMREIEPEEQEPDVDPFTGQEDELYVAAAGEYFDVSESIGPRRPEGSTGERRDAPESLAEQEEAIKAMELLLVTASQELERLRAEMKAMEQAVKAAEAELLFAANELKRNTEMVKAGTVHERELARAQRDHEVAKAALATAGARLEAARNNQQAAERRIKLLESQLKARQARAHETREGPRVVDAMESPYGAEPAPRPGAVRELSPADKKVMASLANECALQFEQLPLEDVLNFLRQATPVNYVLVRRHTPVGNFGPPDVPPFEMGFGEGPFAAAPRPEFEPVSLSVTTRLDDALDLICIQAGAVWTVRNGAVVVGHRDALAHEPRLAAQKGGDLSPADKEAHANLARRADLQFDTLPLEAALDFLRQTTPLGYVLVHRGLPAGPNEVDLLGSMTLEDALDLICIQTGVVWTVRNGVILVGSRTALEHDPRSLAPASSRTRGSRRRGRSSATPVAPTMGSAGMMVP
jgi:beta-lactamase regulating signal transducer with metallopeptidase domain